MSNQNEIEVGDQVRVILHYHQNAEPEWIEGYVRYTPCATGDSWHIVSYDSGEKDYPVKQTLHYVQQFVLMTLMKKGEEP